MLVPEESSSPATIGDISDQTGPPEYGRASFLSSGVAFVLW